MKHRHLHLSGIATMVRASVAFSLMALCVKLAASRLPSPEIVFFRSFLSAILIFILLKIKRLPVLGTHRRVMVLRGISGFIALSLFFYTLSRLPLGTAVMLNYTAPIFSAILAVIFLGERPTGFLIALILLSFLGVFLLVDARIVTLDLTVFLGLLSALFASVAYVTIRHIRHRESPLTIMFYFTGISSLGSLFFLPGHFLVPDLREWLLIGGITLSAFYGQLWLTVALRRAPASLVSPFSYLSPLLSFVYGLFLWQETLTPRACAGALMIIVGGSLIPWIEGKIGTRVKT